MAVHQDPPRPQEAIDLTFWPAGVMNLPFSAHLEIAQAGGFDSLAVAPKTCKRLMAQGLRLSDIADMAGERGITLRHVDGIATWVDAWWAVAGNPDVNRVMYDQFDVELEEALDIGQAIGATSAVGVGFFDEGTHSIDKLVEAFGIFCDKAKSRDITVDLEFIPVWGIPDLPMAWEIVRSADRDNATIMIDTWHLQKGAKNFDRDMALLGTIPAERLGNVQLADAALQPRAETLAGDAFFRKFPGEGELAITAMLAAVAARSGLKSVGPEIVGPDLVGLSPNEIGLRAGATTRNAIGEVQRA